MINSLGQEEFIVKKRMAQNHVLYKNFNSALKLEGITWLIHGSWADGSQNEFSDIDDLIIIDDTNLTYSELKRIIKTLNKIDMLYCRLDPLQHHGHWITSVSELKDYNNAFIPLFILKDALLVIGNPKILFRINKKITEERLKSNILISANYLILYSKKLLAGNSNLYLLKKLVSTYTLMPALLFQFKGLSYDKKLAIEKADEIYSETGMYLLKWSESCRTNWKAIIKTKKYWIYSKIVYLFFNPYIWRKFAFYFSPKIRMDKVNDVCGKNYNLAMVEKFVRECEDYVS